MENWTDYTDTLSADDADALAAVAEAGIPDADDEGAEQPLPVYGCAENEGEPEIVCDEAAYADGDACPKHGGPTEEQRRAYLLHGTPYYE